MDGSRAIELEVEIKIIGQSGYSSQDTLYGFNQKITLDETTDTELRRKLDNVLEKVVTETKAHHQIKIAFHDRQEFIKKELKRITQSDNDPK